MTTPLFMLSCGSLLQQGDIDELSAAVGLDVDVHVQRGRGIADQWQSIVAVARDIGAIAVSASALLGLAEKVIQWRSNLRAKQRDADVLIRAPDREELSLLRASDDEVRTWMLKLERDTSKR